MTGPQEETWDAVAEANLAGKWYRASSNGQRVTLAALWRHGVLERRVWRHGKNSSDNAHEYRLTTIKLA